MFSQEKEGRRSRIIKWRRKINEFEVDNEKQKRQIEYKR
jgi:hypothetical protein